jgi:thiamine transport system ATP-binding protein
MLRLERLEIGQGTFRLLADLDVRRGAAVAIMGPSGGGKSTLLSVLAGFLAPFEGRVLWEGRDLGPIPPGQRPVAVLFQDNNLFPNLTVLQNTALGIRATLRPRAKEREQAQAALALVGLSGLGDRRPGQLSGGQQGRAALARLLVQDRPLVLMDEPFAALGPALKAEMLDLTREVLGGRGATLLMVTHDPRDAEVLAEAVIVVAEGRAAPPVPTTTLLSNPPAPLRTYLGARR